jgi:hypothetical protein
MPQNEKRLRPNRPDIPAARRVIRVEFVDPADPAEVDFEVWALIKTGHDQTLLRLVDTMMT